MVPIGVLTVEELFNAAIRVGLRIKDAFHRLNKVWNVPEKQRNIWWITI